MSTRDRSERVPTFTRLTVYQGVAPFPLSAATPIPPRLGTLLYFPDERKRERNGVPFATACLVLFTVLWAC